MSQNNEEEQAIYEDNAQQDQQEENTRSRSHSRERVDRNVEVDDYNNNNNNNINIISANLANNNNNDNNNNDNNNSHLSNTNGILTFPSSSSSSNNLQSNSLTIPPSSDNQPKKKMNADFQYKIKYLCSSNEAGSVIGKGGKRLREMEQECNATLQISDAKRPRYPLTPYRIGYVGCDDFGNFLKAVSYCVERVLISQQDSGSLLLPNGAQGTLNDPTECKFQLLVPTRSSGACIGSQGKVIKAIQKDTNTTVVVEGMRETMRYRTSERIVFITGEPTNVIESCSRLLKEINESETGFVYDNPTIHYQGNPGRRGDGYGGGYNNDRQYNNRYMQQGGGGGRGGGRGFQRQGGPGYNRRQYDDRHDNNNSMNRGWGGNNNNSNNNNNGGGHNNHNNINNNRWDNRNMPPGDMIGKRGRYDNNNSSNNSGGINGSQNQMLRPIYNNDTSSKRVAIEERYVGAIIGKGGSTIRKIQEECNARIHIEDKNPQGNGHRHLNITGSSDAISSAQTLIQQIMGAAMTKFNQAPNQFTGGGGGGNGGGGGGGNGGGGPPPSWGGNNNNQSSSYNYQGSSYGAIGSNGGNNGNNNGGGGGGYQYY